LPSPELRVELDRLGTVRYLLAPNAWCELDVEPWQAWWPALILLAPAGWRDPAAARGARDGASARRVELGRLRTDVEAVDEELGAQPLGGIARLDEWAFLHRASRSLLVGDLVRGIAPGGSLISRLLGASALGRGPLGTPRDVRWLVSDRARLRESVAVVLGWPFDRVVPRRGPVVDSAGPAAFRQALRWLDGSGEFWE
jgi:hypothetical protein